MDLLDDIHRILAMTPAEPTQTCSSKVLRTGCTRLGFWSR
jgi:hypothetical protein